MPMGLTYENALKVLGNHMSSGEEKPLAVLPIGRKLLALTSEERVILTSYPMFGASKVKEEYTASQIRSFEYNSTDSKVEIAFDVGNLTKLFKAVITPFFPTESEIKRFDLELNRMTESAKPSYLDGDESVIETSQSREGVFKLTNKNVIMLTPSRRQKGRFDVVEKTPISALKDFDFYPVSSTSLKLYFTKEDGSVLAPTIGSSTAMFRDIIGKKDPDAIAGAVVGAMAAHGLRPKPAYIADDEEILTTMRVAHSQIGAIAPKGLLRVTTKRLIEMSTKSGSKAEIDKVIGFDEIAKAKLVEHRGEHAQRLYYSVRLKTASGQKHKFYADAEYQWGIEKIRDLINRYEADTDED